MERTYRECIKCIMDTTDSEITFNTQGICNHCCEYERKAKEGVFTGDEAKGKLDQIIEKIKQTSKSGKKYNCIIGLSGGVDSTYLAYLVVKQFGLKPLAVHFDNGWDSELAVKNIENIVTKLGIDLYTYVVDWEEFKDIQLAYLKASVIDVEVPTDHLISAVLYKLARTNKIKYILSGSNIVTEAVLPNTWIFSSKLDLANLKSIHKQYGTVKLRNFPTLGYWQRFYYKNIHGVESVSLLNYVPYNKKEVKEFIIKELEWKDYGGKHYESVFTRFYQGYILPVKFGVDKRKAHLSNLICSGQITREEALDEIQKPAYNPELLKTDKEYVIKKFGLTEKEFEDIMKLPVRQHTDFSTEKPIYDQFPALKPLRPLGNALKKALS